MRRTNVYITNVVKCRWVPGASGDNKLPIVNNCSRRFLAREVAILAPKVAFCFGEDTEHEARPVLERALPRRSIKRLLHPSYIRDRCQVHRRTRQECIDKNDREIREVLRYPYKGAAERTSGE